MKPGSNVFLRIENLLLGIAGSSLFLMMVLVVVDVAMRYIFNRPLAFVNEVVSLYLLAIIFFFALSATSRSRGHISVDVLKNRLDATGRRVTEAFGALVGLVFFGCIGWLGWLRMIDSYAGDDRLLGVIAWPVWTADAVVPLGCTVLCIRQFVTVYGHVMSAITGRSLIPEPPADAEQENLE